VTRLLGAIVLEEDCPLDMFISPARLLTLQASSPSKMFV